MTEEEYREALAQLRDATFVARYGMDQSRAKAAWRLFGGAVAELRREYERSRDAVHSD